jgi:hypothetical protein
MQNTVKLCPFFFRSTLHYFSKHGELHAAKVHNEKQRHVKY